MSNKLKRKSSIANKKISPVLNVSNYTENQISKATGVKIELLKAWKDARENEIRQAAIKESQEKLWKAEDYIAVANILISLYAIKMTWGFTKANQRFLENVNPATQYVEKIGVQKAYEQAHREMGITLEFDSIDMNKEFNFESYDFREEGFEGKYGIEIWNEAWEVAKDLGNVVNTCSVALVLKKEFNFKNSDLKKLIELSNQKSDSYKKESNGVSDLIEEFEKETKLNIGKENKELARRYGL